MNIEVGTSHGESIHLALEGKMDLTSVQTHEGEILAQIGDGSKSVVLDLSKVTFIGSMGVRLLLLIVKSLKPAGKRLVILKPSPLVREVLEISGIDEVLSISDDPAQAAILAGGAGSAPAN